MNKYYKPSGKFSPMSLIYFLALSLIAFPLMGLVYAYCIWYIPFIYINFIIAGAFGFGVGFLANKFIIGKGKLRNVPLTFILVAFSGIVALYFHWAVWVDLVINAGESYGNSRLGITVSNIDALQVFSLAMQPGILFELIGEINTVGTWGLSGSAVSGTFLSVIWGIEFLIIVVIALMIAMPRVRQPFCELGNKWFAEQPLPPFEYIEDAKQFVAQLEKEDPAVFNALKRAEGLEQDHSVMQLYTSDYNESFLSIENKKAKYDKKGKIDFNTEIVASYIALNTAQKDALAAR